MRNLASVIKFFICSLIPFLRGESKEVRGQVWGCDFNKNLAAGGEGCKLFYHYSFAKPITSAWLVVHRRLCLLQRVLYYSKTDNSGVHLSHHQIWAATLSSSPDPAAWSSPYTLSWCLGLFFLFSNFVWLSSIGRSFQLLPVCTVAISHEYYLYSLFLMPGVIKS